MKEKKNIPELETRNVKTAIEKDIENSGVLNIKQDSSSELIQAMRILHSSENIESNTILTNKQVNALSLMNWASQVYRINFFKHYVSLFPKYRISGDDGRGRSELIQIASAIQQAQQNKDDRLYEMLGKR
jgi:hypothetical protein